MIGQILCRLTSSVCASSSSAAAVKALSAEFLAASISLPFQPLAVIKWPLSLSVACMVDAQHTRVGTAAIMRLCGLSNVLGTKDELFISTSKPKKRFVDIGESEDCMCAEERASSLPVVLALLLCPAASTAVNNFLLY
jgi:hypothetical protein